MGQRRIPASRHTTHSHHILPHRVGLSCVPGNGVPTGALSAHVEPTYGAVRAVRPPRPDHVICCAYPNGRVWRATRHTGTTWGEFHRRLARQMNEQDTMFRIRWLGEYVEPRAVIPRGVQWVDLEHRMGVGQEQEQPPVAAPARERSRSRDRDQHAEVEEDETLYIFYTESDQVWRLPISLTDLQRPNWQGITAAELGRTVIRTYPALFHPTERLVLAADINILRNTDVLDEWIPEADIGIVRSSGTMERACRRRRRLREDSSEESPPYRPAPAPQILDPGLALLQPPHRDNRAVQVAHRPTVPDIFGIPPEGAQQVFGLPSPDQVLQGYFREIEERADQEPRLPLLFQRDTLRVMVVGAGPHYAMEVRWREPTINLGQMRMLSRTHGVLENRQAHFARINGEQLQENVQYQVANENVWWMICHPLMGASPALPDVATTSKELHTLVKGQLRVPQTKLLLRGEEGLHARLASPTT